MKTDEYKRKMCSSCKKHNTVECSIPDGDGYTTHWILFIRKTESEIVYKCAGYDPKIKMQRKI